MTQRVHHTVVIGAGFAGLGMAAGLVRAGRSDFVVLEKADDLGGTWRENIYPGCECDVPSVLYSYSFSPNSRWSGVRAAQSEILRYLGRVADEHRIRERIEFGVEVANARWDESGARWHVRTTTGREYVARFLVVATGALHLPKVPTIPGAESFRGAQFHTAHWDHSVDLAGKSVAVVGTGASAIQVVPQIADRAGSLQLYQRTPPWVLPRRERLPVPRTALGAKVLRGLTYCGAETLAVGLNGHPALVRPLERRALRHLRRQVGDPALRATLTPDYRIGCKRILRSNTYFPAVAGPRTEVITERIAEIRPHAVVAADGTVRPVDVIVYATGFRVAGALAGMPLVGRGGVGLQQRWLRDGIRTHLGITVSGLPNAFLLTGPNTGLGHTSVVFMIESQVRYVLAAMDLVAGAGARAIDVRADAQAEFHEELHGKLATAVWSTGGCRSWYVDAQGSNHSLWPGFSWQYRMQTRRVDRGVHELF
ncbi:flavin-containing monooxygenase [Rhodococcus sp. NPDC059234]|uniref:flavin-containing monooxygenase n=1 Tax=Rhodococcus sp. NPDC059234 TaxID=3346781 RepID=UPI003670C71C